MSHIQINIIFFKSFRGLDVYSKNILKFQSKYFRITFSAYNNYYSNLVETIFLIQALNN